MKYFIHCQNKCLFFLQVAICLVNPCKMGQQNFGSSVSKRQFCEFKLSSYSSRAVHSWQYFVKYKLNSL